MPIVTLDSMNFSGLAWTFKFLSCKHTDTSIWSRRTIKFKHRMLKDRICFITQICCKFGPCGKSQSSVVNIVTMLPHPSLMVRVLDRSDKTIKDYCNSFDILTGIKDINIAWEEMSVNCLDGVWH